MKTLVGVDVEGTYRAALNLCQRLRFPDQEWILAHAIPPTPLYAAGLAPMAMPVAEVVTSLRESGREALRQARESLGDLEAVELMLEGSAGACLMKIADDHEAELIVAGSSPKHGLFSGIGSVSRALSIGSKQSLLLTKTGLVDMGPVHAVFATDHSKYAKCALDRLISWAPEGFARIDVVTAYQVSLATAAMLRQDVAVELEFDTWVAEHARKESEIVAQRLRAITPETEIRVQKGETNEVIHDTMTESGADLLIVGAQGHGFIDRVLVGSVSLHQVFAEPYPVLLIRLP